MLPYQNFNHGLKNSKDLKILTKIYCGAANPNIIKPVKLLHQYEITARDKYINATKVTAKALQQTTQQIIRESRFRQLRKLFREQCM